MGSFSDGAGITVFLDRDGTLNYDTGYVASPEQFVLIPGAGEAVARLNGAGIKTVLVTNQSGLARGLFTWEDLTGIHQALQIALQAQGGKLDGLYICPHHPDEHCDCRKPKRGLIDRAVADLHLDPGCSYVVGDKLLDLELAENIGAVGVLVLSGPTSQDARKMAQEKKVKMAFEAQTLVDAVDWILRDAQDRVWPSS